MKSWRQDTLTLELAEVNGEHRVRWIGRSTARDPARFVGPVVKEVFEGARQAGARVVFDFAALDYMNSATVTSVVRALEESRRLSVPVVLEYSLARRWQDLSFAALRTFQTTDGRVKVTGK